MLKDLLGGLIAPVTEWMRQRGERARIRAEGQVEIAKAEIAADVATAQAAAVRAHTQTDAERDWDNAAATAASRSWKDELWTLVFAIPIVLAFVPGCAPFVAVGFAAIASAPGWYQAGFAASVAFAFGVRHVMAMVRDKWR